MAMNLSSPNRLNVIENVFPPGRRDAAALICGGETLTFGELERRVEEAARRLVEAGLPLPRPGVVPRIGLASPNGLEHVVLALAILKTGGCLVPIAGELADPEREALVRTVRLHAVLLASSFPWPERIARNPGAVRLPGLDALLFKEPEAGGEDPGFEESRLAAINPAFIRFSSGTTGRAKGVVLSHATLLGRIESANHRLNITEKDRVVWILPMAHHFAVSIMLYLLKGAATVIVNSHLGGDVLDAALEHGGTVLYGAPFHHALLAREPSGRPWPGLRLAVSTAAALPAATARAFYERYGTPLAQGLGIIEVGLPFLNTADPLHKPGSIGRPGPDVAFQLRLLAGGEGEERPPGDENVGELLVRAEGIFDAYLNPWCPREEALAPGGWFPTGDIARLDPEGFLHLVGRVKSVINVAGMKCFPEEVEAVLSVHPGVRAAFVHGREHPQFGAVPVAEIVAAEPAPSAATLAGHCRKALAAYKIPVEFRFVDSLPRTASGKIRRC